MEGASATADAGSAVADAGSASAAGSAVADAGSASVAGSASGAAQDRAEEGGDEEEGHEGAQRSHRLIRLSMGLIAPMLAAVYHQPRWILAALPALCLCTAAAAQYGAADGEWRHHGGDDGFTRYTALDQINGANFNRLEPAWKWASADSRIEENSPYRRQVLRSSPLVVDGRLYLPTELSQVAALDAADRRGTLGLRPEELRARQAGPEQLLHARPRVLDRR